MKYAKSIITGSALLIGISSFYGQCGTQPSAAQKEENAPIWADEFNTNGAPDSLKWGYDIGNGNNGWGNAEAQYYTSRPENVEVSDGTLKIKAIKEDYNGSAYTSARLLTKGKFDFTYGRVEVRAKLPAGKGTWPAIWLLGSNVDKAGWPECGEIDIMEHAGNRQNKIDGTVHYPGGYGANGPTYFTTLTDASENFHVYALDWSPTVIKWYVDGKEFSSFDNNKDIPFNHDFFVLLNFAVGGSFGGLIDPAFTGGVFEVDYVRVYKN
jgi:beta-glucanase (GH16 family)